MMVARVKPRRIIVAAAALVCILAGPAASQATQALDRWEICIRDHVAGQPQSMPQSALAIDVSATIQEIADSIELAADISSIPCHRVARAVTFVSYGQSRSEIGGREFVIPAGEYMLYNPQWVREVIGADWVQATALFGHELGHIFNRDFAPQRLGVSRVQRETAADGFAGCAVAARGGDWSGVESLFLRLRGDREDLYPNRLQSIEAARQGFNRCLRAGAANVAQPSSCSANDPPIPIAIVLNESRPHIVAMHTSFQEEVERVLGQECPVTFGYAVGSANAGDDEQNRVAFETALNQAGDREDIRALVTIGTNVSVYAVAHYSNLPIYFVGVTDPVRSRLVDQDEIETRGVEKNISGYANGIDLRSMVTELAECFDGRSFGFLYNPTQPQDVIVRDFLSAQDVINVTPIPIEGVEIPSQASVDIYFGWNFVNTNISDFLRLTPRRPILGAAHDNLRKGAFAIYGSDHGEVGRMAGETFARNFILNRTAMSQIPVQRPSLAEFDFNEAALQRFNLTVSLSCRVRNGR